MSDGARVRKDGRQLYFDHPVTAEDEIEILSADEEKSLRATLCRASREPDEESNWDT